MVPKLGISIRVLLAIVAACCTGAWLAKPWLYPNRIPGRRIALIGPMDLDRDGRDDRAKLAAMIARNGGVVAYDLPVAGPATGRLAADTSWYIVGEPPPGSNAPAPFLKAKAGAISEARANGVPPIALAKLVAKLEGR